METLLSKSLYVKCFEKAGISKQFINFFIENEMFENEVFQPFFKQKKAYPWPPFFLPILKYRSGTESYGVGYHPFHSDRRPSFMKIFIESGYVAEVSRTEDQFMDLLCLESSLNFDNDDVFFIEKASSEMLAYMGRDGSEAEILNAMKKTGVIEDALSQYVESFQEDWPLFLQKEKGIGGYNGNFPGTLNTKNISSCLYEMNFFDASGLAGHSDNNNSEGDFGSQWMRLQAPSISVVAAREKISEIGISSDDKSGLIDAWMQASTDDYSNY